MSCLLRRGIEASEHGLRHNISFRVDGMAVRFLRALGGKDMSIYNVKYFKVLNLDGTAYNGGIGKWNLPKNGEPGEWMPKIETIIPCQSGYHLCEMDDLILWLGPAIYTAEGKGEFIRHNNDKTVFQQARLLRHLDSWNERTARLFAADCAEHVLPIFEKYYPADQRPRICISASRDFANGKITREQLTAARAALWSAAFWAAAAAAAAAAATATAAARDAAWAAAAAAATATATATAAARDAAWAAEKKWQAELLKTFLGEP